MKIPENTRREVQEWLWSEADRLDWLNLTAAEKSSFYSSWASSASVGGKLGAFMDPLQIRVYLKDTLLKSYSIERSADHSRPYRVLGLSSQLDAAEVYKKPHGHRLEDGRVIAWSNAADWKHTVLAVFERSYVSEEYQPYGVVFFQAGGKYSELSFRHLVEDAAKKLEIKHIVWLD